MPRSLQTMLCHTVVAVLILGCGSNVDVNGFSPPLLSIPNGFDTLTSGLSSIVRLPRGVTVSPNIQTNETVQLTKFKDIENRYVLYVDRHMLVSWLLMDNIG
jgi:hypothetical protein